MIEKIVLMTVIMLCLFLIGCSRSQQNERISAFGKYKGYSTQRYNDYIKTSDYIRIPDGTRLAFDLFLPAVKDEAVQAKLPVLFCYTTYLRAWNMFPGGKLIESEDMPLGVIARLFLRIRAFIMKDGNVLDTVFREPWLKEMLKQGYAVIVVEARGTGASEGVVRPVFTKTAEDIGHVLDWISAQTWCNGRIGMFGKSMVAMNQYAAASTGHPCLKAIFPVSAGFDMYDAVVYPGGIYNRAFADMLTSSTGMLEKLTVPVDTDTNGDTLKSILSFRKEHFSLDRSAERGFRKAPFRDSRSSYPDGDRLWEDMGPYTLLQKVNAAGIPVYNATGWKDIFTRDAILWHANLTVPRKLYISSASHAELGKKTKELNHNVEARRWFDHWLKGVDNNIMAEPSINYLTMGPGGKSVWRSTKTWPLRQVVETDYYFQSQGQLSQKQCTADEWSGWKQVDYTATSGQNSRWCAIMKKSEYSDMTDNDRRVFAFTSEPLTEAIRITGHPVAAIALQTDAPDLDVFVYLEEVDAKGNSRYLTEGCIRSSHRQTCMPSYDNFGLPYHRSKEKDLLKVLPGKTFHLSLDLLPLSLKIARGNCLRVAVAFSDQGNYETRQVNPKPRVRIRCQGDTKIVLPVAAE